MAKGEGSPTSHNPNANIIGDKGVYGREYSNGKQNWYLEDPKDGENPHIGEDEMLAMYGYDKTDFPDRPPTPASKEADPVTPVDPPTPPPTPKDPSVSDSVAEAMRSSLEAGTRYDEKATAFTAEKKETDRTELIEKLNEDMEFMTLSAVAFEKTGDLVDRDKAFFKFAEMFDSLAELKGWDKEKRDDYLSKWTSMVEKMLEGDKKPDPGDDPDEDEEAIKAAEEIEKSKVLTELKGRLNVARDRLAKLNVQASGRIFIGPKLKQELEEAREVWRELQVEVGAQVMNDIMAKNAGTTLDQLAGFAAQGAKNEATALSQAQLDAIEAGPDGGFIKRWMHKYATAYNNAGKFKKVLLLAPAGVIVGAGVGTIFGAIGGGLMAGLVARGAVRGALTAKMQALRSKGGTELAEADRIAIGMHEEDMARAGEILALKAAVMNETATKANVKGNSRENKKRAGIAISIGAAAGIASGMLANHLTDQSLVRGSGIIGKKTGWDPFHGQKPGGGHHPGPRGGTPPPTPRPLPKAELHVPIIDGKPFLVDLERAGVVPRGQGQALVNFLHARGLDNGVDIPGFKDLRTWHTVPGYSPLSPKAIQAIADFKAGMKP